MTTARLTHRFLAEHARSPLNLVLLVLVPIVFVTLSAGALADFAELLGGTGHTASIEANTAGWAAAFLAGLAGYFQVRSSREADRRLVLAGMEARSVAGARLASGLALAFLGTAAALVALALRAGVDDPARIVAASAMFAVVYLAIGAIVGMVVRDEVNGAVLILFVWFLDVFLGPTMRGGDDLATRLFPTHFHSRFVVEAAAGHGGAVGDLGWALVWTVGSLGAAASVFALTVRPAGGRRALVVAHVRRIRPRGEVLTPSGRAGRDPGTKRRQATRRSPRGGAVARVGVGLRLGLREQRRNVLLWILLLVVPFVFITLAVGVTPDGPAPVELVENGGRSVAILSMVDVHGATMAPITVAFLAALTGVYVVLGSAEADRRLALAGFRPHELLAVRAGIVAVGVVFVSAVSVAVTAIDFAPQRWLQFTLGILLVGLTYALLGVVIGPLVGRLGGLYLAVLFSFVDVGLAQNVMFDAAPPAWGAYMPARGAMSLLVDGAFTPGFDEPGALLLALGWLAVAGAAALSVFHRHAEARRA